LAIACDGIRQIPAECGAVLLARSRPWQAAAMPLSEKRLHAISAATSSARRMKLLAQSNLNSDVERRRSTPARSSVHRRRSQFGRRPSTIPGHRNASDTVRLSGVQSKLASLRFAPNATSRAAGPTCPCFPGMQC